MGAVGVIQKCRIIAEKLACKSLENAKSLLLLLSISIFFETKAKIVALVNTAAAMTIFRTINQCEAMFIWWGDIRVRDTSMQ